MLLNKRFSDLADGFKPKRNTRKIGNTDKDHIPSQQDLTGKVHAHLHDNTSKHFSSQQKIINHLWELSVSYRTMLLILSLRLDKGERYN